VDRNRSLRLARLIETLGADMAANDGRHRRRESLDRVRAAWQQQRSRSVAAAQRALAERRTQRAR
jgi:hypothetical protein